MLVEDEDGMISTSTSLWGRDVTGGENSGEVGRYVRADTQEKKPDNSSGNGKWAGLSDEQIAMDTDTYRFNGYTYNEHAGAEVSREIVENGTNITYKGMWISEGFLANYSLDGPQTSYASLNKLVFTGEFRGGTIGGLDLLGGGGGFLFRRLQAHHLIPKKVYKQNKKLFKSLGYKRDNWRNLILLPTPFHGNHPAYSSYVKHRLRALGFNPTKKDIVGVQNSLRAEIKMLRKKGESSLNQYYKDLGY